MAAFGIDKYDRVTVIELSTPATSVAEAGRVLRELGNALGMNLDGLDEAVARATLDNPQKFEGWSKSLRLKWARAWIGFEPTTHFVRDESRGNREMRAIANFTFEWEPTEIGPVFRTTPIQPPKGYEYLTMEIPGSDLMARVQGSTDPAYAHLQIKSLP